MFEYKMYNSDIVKCLHNIKNVDKKSFGKLFEKHPNKIDYFIEVLDYIATSFKKYEFNGISHKTLHVETNFLTLELMECLNDDYITTAAYKFFQNIIDMDIKEIHIKVSDTIGFYTIKSTEYLFNTHPSETNYKGV